MKLYALFVGINAYAVPRLNLNGCVADLNDFRGYLAELAKSSKAFELDDLVLTNEKATRANVIAGFSHFAKAQKGDICLFYYSGHGSQIPVPTQNGVPMFDEPTGLCETIVCHDSRLPNGADIVDKELAYLIWNATKDKNVQFTAVMDCCHSGSNTRDTDIRARMAERGNAIADPAAILGLGTPFFTTKKLKDGRTFWQAKTGRHWQMAAAAAEQTAKELRIGTEVRGAFTYNLVQTLRQFGGDLTCDALTNRVRLSILNTVVAQTPNYEALGGAKSNAVFLNGALPAQTFKRQLYYDATKKAWLLDAGGLHGLRTGAVIRAEKQQLTVTAVQPASSVVTTPTGLDMAKIYDAEITDWGIAKTKIAFATPAKTADKATETAHTAALAKAKTALAAALKKEAASYFELVEEASTARYMIDAFAGAYVLLLPKGKQPLFKRVDGGFNTEQTMQFIEKIETVCRYDAAKALCNPATTLKNPITVAVEKVDGTTLPVTTAAETVSDK